MVSKCHHHQWYHLHRCHSRYGFNMIHGISYLSFIISAVWGKEPATTNPLRKHLLIGFFTYLLSLKLELYQMKQIKISVSALSAFLHPLVTTFPTLCTSVSSYSSNITSMSTITTSPMQCNDPTTVANMITNMYIVHSITYKHHLHGEVHRILNNDFHLIWFASQTEAAAQSCWTLLCHHCNYQSNHYWGEF